MLFFSPYLDTNMFVCPLQDLMFWMTLGVQHIPHTEDLSMTPTAGKPLTLVLLFCPYFPECLPWHLEIVTVSIRTHALRLTAAMSVL